MIDICFVGNSSIDQIQTKYGSKKVFGGSCIYSALSCRISTEKSIAIISNVNHNLSELLYSYDIKIIGNICDNISSFGINEINNTCVFINEFKKDIKIIEPLFIDNLHISFRKSVDFEAILNNPNIHYNNLSVDVMIHSVEKFIIFLQKYSNIINTLFCNSKEYLIIKEYINNIPNIIITNENQPVILINKNNNYSFKIKENKKTISNTGAGDNFIGGYLAKYSENKSLEECMNEGINNSYHSIENYGPLFRKKRDLLIFNSSILPNNIIVIGNSCAGKTTFVDTLKTLYNIYVDIDDLPLLLEMFEIDDKASSGNIEDLLSLKLKIKYMNDIYLEYLNNYGEIKHYSIMAKDGNGHDIINPLLWDIILEKAITYSKGKNNIIQFSRGRDEKYERLFGKKVYERSLQTVVRNLPNNDKTIIINLSSDLNIRKERNYKRLQSGGHFVSEDTMNQIYSQDLFNYEHIDENKGFIYIDDIQYPVYTVFNNKMLSKVELDDFLLYNLNEIINYFNMFRRRK